MAAVFAPLDRDREDRRRDRRLRRHRQRQLDRAGGHRRRHRRRRQPPSSKCQQRGFQTAMLPVSHAFHTSIVAPASEPLRRTLERLELRPPEIPIVANVTGELYPMGPDVVPEMLDLLAAQVASPVQFVQGSADAVRRGRPRVRGGRAEEGAAGLRRRRPRRRRRRPGHQPPEARRRHRLQPGAVRPLRGRVRRGRGRADVGVRAVTEVSRAGDPAQPRRRAASSTAAPAAEPVVITGAALGLPGAPQRVRRRQRRPHPARRAGDRRHPDADPPRDRWASTSPAS